MGTKTVSLRQSAYRKLRAMKKEGESFSDVVERIAESRGLEDLEGAFPEIGEVKESIEQERSDAGMRESR